MNFKFKIILTFGKEIMRMVGENGRGIRKWQPTPVLLPGKSHGQRSLVGYIVHEVAKSRTRLSDFTHS